MKISLRRRHALTVADGAFSLTIEYVIIFQEILNPEGYPNRITGSKVVAIFLNGWILPIGGASNMFLNKKRHIILPKGQNSFGLSINWPAKKVVPSSESKKQNPKVITLTTHK